MRVCLLFLSVFLSLFMSCSFSPVESVEEDSEIINVESFLQDVFSCDDVDGLSVDWREAKSGLTRRTISSNLVAEVIFDGYHGSSLSDGISEIESGTIEIDFTVNGTADLDTATFDDFSISTIEDLKVVHETGNRIENAVFTGRGNAAGTEISVSYSNGIEVTVSGDIHIDVDVNITINTGTGESESGTKLLEADVEPIDGLEIESGSIFTPSDYIITLYFSDGSSKELSGSDDVLIPYSPVIDKENFKVLVSYENQTVVSEIAYDFPVILPKAPVSGTIRQTADFLTGQFDLSEFEVKITYNDGSVLVQNLSSLGITVSVSDDFSRISATVGVNEKGELIEAKTSVVYYNISHLAVSGPAVFEVDDPDSFDIPESDVSVTAYYYDSTGALCSMSLKTDEYRIEDIELAGESSKATVVALVGGTGASADFTFNARPSKYIVGGSIMQTGDFLIGQTFDSSKFTVNLVYNDGQVVSDNGTIEVNLDEGNTVRAGSTVSAFIGKTPNGSDIISRAAIAVYDIARITCSAPSSFIVDDPASFDIPESAVSVTAHYYDSTGALCSMSLKTDEYRIEDIELAGESSKATVVALVGGTGASADFTFNARPSKYIVGGSIMQTGDFLIGQTFDSSKFTVNLVYNDGQVVSDNGTIEVNLDEGNTVRAGSTVSAFIGKTPNGSDIISRAAIAVYDIARITCSAPSSFIVDDPASFDIPESAVSVTAYYYDSTGALCSMSLKTDEYRIEDIELAGESSKATVVALVGGSGVSADFTFNARPLRYVIGGLIIQTGDFLIGQTFDPSKFEVLITYDDGSARTISGDGIVVLDEGSVVKNGSKVIAEIGQDFMGNDINVQAAMMAFDIISIDVTGPSSYPKGTDIPEADLSVTAHYIGNELEEKLMLLDPSEFLIVPDSTIYENGEGASSSDPEVAAMITVRSTLENNIIESQFSYIETY